MQKFNIQKLSNGDYLINKKVIIDKNGTLWNDFDNLKPYKDFPKCYFKLRDSLIGGQNV